MQLAKRCRVDYRSLEMTKEQLVHRVLCATASPKVCSDALCTFCIMLRCRAAIRSSSAVISSAVRPLMARLCSSGTSVRSFPRDV